MTQSSLETLSDSIADAVEEAGKQIVGVSARRRGLASGVQWAPGVIVTADHVIEREENITVLTPEGSRVQATLTGRDPSTDLAVLSVTGWAASTKLEKYESPRPGQLVVAVGRHGESGLSVSFGALSSVGPEFRTHAGGRVDLYLRPDLTFYPGFSGGPLLAAGGDLLGINTSGLAHGLPLTLPSATVDRVVEQLLKSGRVSRGYLGLRLQSVDLGSRLAEQHHLEKPYGLLVVGVEPEGPGAAAGVMVGDVVVSLNGASVAESDGVQVILDPESVGKTLPGKVVRGGEVTDISITVGERPARRHGHG